MKNYSSYLYLLLLSGIVLGGVSCKKDLNAGPINATYSSEFWTSQSSVEQAALSMYGQFRACIRSSNCFFTNGDYVSGTFASTAWNYTPFTIDQQFDFPTATADYLGDLTNWSRYYSLVAQCNLILEQVPKMPLSDFNNDTSIVNGYIGEALFMRALTYFFITRCWGDPVYITKTYDNVDYGNIPPVARTPEAAVLDSCIRDLQVAAGYLSFKGGDVSQVLRANKGSVYALMAHIYAWQHDYKDAHLACAQVINNGGYTLEPATTYTNIWKGQSSLENIMEIAMQFNSNDPNFLTSADGYNDYNSWTEAQFDFFSVFLKDSLDNGLTVNAWVADSAALDILYNTANVTDMRLNTILKLVNASNGDPGGYLLTKYTNFTYQNPSAQSNAYINNNIALFRLADIYLLDAEALAQTGNFAGAVTDMNYTRERAGIGDYSGPMDATDLTYQVFLERSRELIGEGQTFFDMIRTQPYIFQLTQTLNYPPARVAQKGYYWPLDLGTLFSQDALLTQNPYWSANS